MITFLREMLQLPNYGAAPRKPIFNRVKKFNYQTVSTEKRSQKSPSNKAFLPSTCIVASKIPAKKKDEE